jgi:anti-sigma regulatory factor (Ser/Thr protein kinase)
MSGSEQRVFRARRDELPGALGFVESFCQQHGVAAEVALRLTLIVEELFTNVIVHGHRGDSDAVVDIELQAAPQWLVLCLHDSAPPFDPLRHLANEAPDLDRAESERRVGGLGLPLVAQMSEGFAYAYVEGRNRISLRVRIDG